MEGTDTLIPPIHQHRVKKLTGASPQQGPVIYWMSRDMRVQDNWALLYAQELARQQEQPLIVVFCLREIFPYATARLLHFMLDGLKEVEIALKQKNISFQMLLGDPVDTLPSFIHQHTIGTIVTDVSPLRIYRQWKETLAATISIPFYEVDTHNIIPVWTASPKQEFAAYTFRPKVQKQLKDYLVEIPEVIHHPQTMKEAIKPVDWQHIYSSVKKIGNVPQVTWIVSGEMAAQQMLKEFITKRLPIYAEQRNDPTKDALSLLSPYLHFGHIAAQRVALEVRKQTQQHEGVDAFLEELIVRKELSDNFCYYNTNYDNTKGFPDWATKTLAAHAHDKREHMYTLKALESAETHDPLWNAAQKEMILRGKMHGYLRMYWAKKILEWTKSAEEAMEYAIHLNDTYFLDGRDPNGYVGIAWSIGGVHDRAWFERDIFGKIRYMSYNGAKTKFDIKKYIEIVTSYEIN